MSTVLITGGAGFIGSHLTERCLEEGLSVVVLDNFDPFYDRAIKERNLDAFRDHARVEFVEGDIVDAELVDELFASHEFDGVIHLAALAGVRPSIQQPARYMRVNVEGTTNLLEACRVHGVERFIFGSSSSVYGNRETVPFSESDPVDDPVSPYAASKKANELVCYTYHHLYGLDVTCLRFFTVYGPRQRPEMAIHKFVRRILNGERIPMFGDGSSSRDYTYVADIIEGVWSAWQRAEGYRIYNLGESKTISLADLIREIEKATGAAADVEQLPMQPGDVMRTYADISRARAELDYDPRVSIPDGLRRFVDWYRETVQESESAE